MEHRTGKKRELIRSYLEEHRTHPSAGDIYQALKPICPQLSQATVYRSLAYFLEEGIVTAVATVNGEDRYDPVTFPHQHFVCTHCGQVTDLDVKGISEKEKLRLEKNHGLRISSCTLTLRGLCSDCIRRENEAKASSNT